MYRTKDQNGRIKYSGRSKATVIDNRDPLDRGRVQISHPILGDTVWIEYLHTPGHFSVPSIGDVVYVECDAGNPEFPFCWGNIVKGEDTAPELPDEFRRDIPTNRGMYTPNGHLFEMDDGKANLSSDPKDDDFTTEGRGIRFTSKAGNKIHIVEDADNGVQHILIEDAGGNIVQLDYENEKIVINSIGDQDQAIAGNWTVEVDGDTVIKAGDVKIDTPKTTITGDAEINGQLQVDGDINAKANVNVDSNLQVTGNSQLGGGTPLVLATAQFIGTGNVGAPVISSIMSGQATKVTGS